MSIPPLVCSTPPPPDQCDDDKDHEDFDLSYNLSQEDDDDENNDYNYGNFSSYSHYQSATDNKPLEIKEHKITQAVDTEVTQEIYIQYEHEHGRQTIEQINISHDQFHDSDINENKLKSEEDLNIEDLNLKLNEEILANIKENCDEDGSSEQSTDSLKDQNICNSNGICQDNVNTNALSCENVNNLPISKKESHVYLDEATIEQSYDEKTKNNSTFENIDIKSHLNNEDMESKINLSGPLDKAITSKNPDEVSECVQQSSNEFELSSGQRVTEDDFGDFDSFQSASNKCNITSVVDSSLSNPWENTDNNELELGHFTANFEENECEIQNSSHAESKSIYTSEQLENNVKAIETNLEDDDFGDFDEFKSSHVKTEFNEPEEKDSCQELPVLNLQSSDNDHHIMESITKVLTSVFTEEISEPENEFEGKLESLLSETWGHLMETDERQPYIVNWNNSLGQKTLLKALCIDSRNILFGPKWCSHMPKYAANLSVAPLQPQKQVSSPSNISQSEVVADKTSSKPTTWSDPFTSDGQEFTYAEALLLDLEHLMATLDQMAHNHSTLKISELLSHACNQENESSTITPNPPGLDVFEAAISTKSEKIYSNTLSVQPIRQINLPDTHIFTPTDSEIPRSKTIHYDHIPTVLLSQPVLTESKDTDNSKQNINNNKDKTNIADDNEYWEFQDFKSTSDSNFLPALITQPPLPMNDNFKSATTINAFPEPSVAYQTQLLQPIKAEPSMPTLNWPDPGEVKAAYDDFTDFVSISSQSTDEQGVTIRSSESQETNQVYKSDKLDDIKEKAGDVFTEVKSESEGFEDFNTFQSALPLKDTQNDNIPSPLVTVSNVDNSFPKNNSIKYDSLSFASIPRLNDASTKSLGIDSITTELTNKNLLPVGTQIQTGILQPATSSFNTLNTQNQRTGQILQPLSLESYSQINWPSPGIDLQDLSRFNPVETLQSFKNDFSGTSVGKVASPVHTQKNVGVNQSLDDDVWGEYVSSKPKQQPSVSKKTPVFADDDEWTDFISSPSVKPQNGLNTISLNVHTNSNIQKSVNKLSMKTNQTPIDIPTLNYITPKSNSHKTYNDKHFQNL